MRPVVIVLWVLIVASGVAVIAVVFDGGGGLLAQPNAADQKALNGQFINTPPKSY